MLSRWSVDSERQWRAGTGSAIDFGFCRTTPGITQLENHDAQICFRRNDRLAANDPAAWARTVGGAPCLVSSSRCSGSGAVGEGGGRRNPRNMLSMNGDHDALVARAVERILVDAHVGPVSLSRVPGVIAARAGSPRSGAINASCASLRSWLWQAAGNDSRSRRGFAASRAVVPIRLSVRLMPSE
jgi:hypothetical protein